MTGTTTKGTCPACFRLMALSRGKLSRHGWQEQGGRRVGEYGLAWHVGACFGVGWDPFEVSPDGTVAYVKKVLVPTRTGIENALANLATRPTLYEEYKERVRGEPYGSPNAYATYRVRFDPGQLEVYDRLTHRSYPSYDRVHKGQVAFWEGQLDAVVRETDRCLKAIDTWELRPLQEAPKKRAGRVVHLAKTIEHTFPQIHAPPIVRSRQVAACGFYRMARGSVLLSPDIEDVTCPKCLATVQKNRRRSQRRRSR